MRILEGAMREQADRKGWRSLLEWAAAFALLALAVVGAMSIGIFVVPFAIAAIVLAARRNCRWPEAALGAFLGVGSLCLFIAFLHRDDSPCPAARTLVRVRPGERLSCGGLDPVPWLAIGLLLAAVGLGGYLLFHRTHRVHAL